MSVLNIKSFDLLKLRQDFPALHQTVHGKPLVYLDNAATAQKPQCVIDAVQHYYTHDNANVHRAVHSLSERATRAFESVRKKVQRFINAEHEHEIIFVRGTTEAINLVAQSYACNRFQPDDEILISHMEHHSNIVPWQRVCEQTGAILKVIPINDDGELILEDYKRLLNSRTKLVSVVHISNSLGTVNPVEAIIKHARENGTPVFLDGAQAVVHSKVDVQALGCDFYAFSGHKLFGPTGVGVLYGKTQLLDSMPPYQSGGDMIKRVSFEKTEYRELPHKFEAGTPSIASVIGLGAALDYLGQLDWPAVYAHEEELLAYATDRLIREIPTLRMIGTASRKAAILAFLLNDVHAHDVGTILDADGIAIRAGHHCTMPLMERFHVPATVRASLAFYNTKEEVDCLIQGLKKVSAIFQ